MLTPDVLAQSFARAETYDRYLATARPHERAAWDRAATTFSLTPAQAATLAAITRRINILCLSGTWCGDCSAQVPMLDAMARAAPLPAESEPGTPGIALRLLDRDANLDLAQRVKIAGGLRVPTVIFTNEDFDFVAITGDRMLARYRGIAARQLGPSCPLPGAPLPPDEVAATLQEWVNEVERVGLLLRLSPKLRERYAD
jgi:thiol-disulfide isomerase/thioredoxin